MIRTLIAGAIPVAIAAIVACVLISAWRDDRHPGAPAASDACKRDLTALADATREPAGQLITRLPRRIAHDDCGCIWFEGGYWSPCIGHDPGFDPPVGRWAAEMEDK